jgi:hypothetical protein
LSDLGRRMNKSWEKDISLICHCLPFTTKPTTLYHNHIVSMRSSSATTATKRARRVVHHKHAAKVAAHWQKLLKLNCGKGRLEHEASAIAGAACKERHDSGYDEYGSMESQRAIDDDAIRARARGRASSTSESLTPTRSRSSGRLGVTGRLASALASRP